jgi:ankyrin repeat protein
MFKKITTLFIVLVSLFMFACNTRTGNEPLTPDMAKNMIKLRGFEPTDAGFVKAVKSNDTAIFKTFYDAGISANAKDEKGESALNAAIQNSEMKTIKALVEKADINLKDGLGNSPMYLAFQKKNETAFNLLLEKGADVNASGTSGKVTNQSLLYLVVTRERDDLIKTLLEKGANPNAADSSNATPLHEVCIGSGAKAETVKLLLEKGANPNTQENNGSTPLIYIATNSDVDSATRVEIVKLLLAAKADKTLKAKSGKTALAWAKEKGNNDIVGLLK